MYVTVNMPATTGFKGRFGAWKARAHRAETRLCQFAECDKDATAAEGTKPLCALHKSFFCELAARRTHPSQYQR
jgi:hypothetical protein